jgi:hypothetical protein
MFSQSTSEYLKEKNCLRWSCFYIYQGRKLLTSVTKNFRSSFMLCQMILQVPVKVRTSFFFPVGFLMVPL